MLPLSIPWVMVPKVKKGLESDVPFISLFLISIKMLSLIQNLFIDRNIKRRICRWIQKLKLLIIFIILWNDPIWNQNFLHSGFFQEKYEHFDKKDIRNKQFLHVENNGFPWSLNSSQLFPLADRLTRKAKLKSLLESHC